MFYGGVSVSFAMFGAAKQGKTKKLSPARQPLDVNSVREY